MDRRNFICLGSTFLASALAKPAMAYSPEVFTGNRMRDLQETGDTMILHFRTNWSLTCQIKDEVIADLVAENPDYTRHIKFITIDWDTYGPSNMVKRLGVERRSTLLALRGKKELGRLVAETDRTQIKRFLDETLVVATA